MAYTTIKKPSDYFNTKLYTGNGTTDTAQTGVGFQPDWTWIKARSIGYDNNLFDVVRGSTKRLIANATTAETTQTEMIKSFDSDGFTLGNDAGVNANTETFASWNWLADNTSGSSNTDGSITSTVSANTTSGFSIVSYTGTGSNATVGHGLGVVPKMIIVKQRSGAGDWTVYNSNIGNTNFLRLNGTLASTPQSTYWNNTTPTSSVFSVGSAGDVNTSSGTHIAYCFAEKKGFSKFGSYTGNGNADGTFVYTGFKPAFVMGKATSGNENWFMNDNKRLGYNDKNYRLYPNLSNNEATDINMDILSNGFKLNSTNGNSNGSGITYIYMAFAEEPLVGDNPATAR
jgi:hypothetical protein